MKMSIKTARINGGGKIVEMEFEEKKNSPTEKWESEDYTSYLYKTSLPYCFIQSLEYAGVQKQSFWNTLRRSFKERMAYRLYIQRG